ncbi:MAG: efflux RND transporter periplasmic adaptor subunit [Opitutaceae bacterium]|nr:efflux RND transporter periplasmic adaptor subunit [Opitutaceae bacterium]
MLKKLTVTLSGLILLVGVLAGIKVLQFQAMFAAGAAMVPPPETVTATVVQEESWEDTISATGSLVAVQGVIVGAEMGGKVVKIAFESGATVKADDLLVQLDLAAEEAQLKATEAAATLARINLDRAKELRAQHSNSQAEYDAAEAQTKQAMAQVDSIRAIIAKKTIRAPFAGRLGLRLVNLGQILREGEAITTLQTLDPIYVNFSLPQQYLTMLAPGMTVRLASDASSPGMNFEGRISAVSPEVDPTTRNVRVQVTLANPEGRLHPGMFAKVDVVLPTRQRVLPIPATAVLYAPYGDSVFIIEEKRNEQSGQVEKVLRQQFVRLGTTQGDFVAVTSGLQAGQSVVTSGVFKLRPGMNVVIDNRLAPDAKLAPTPKDA